MIQNPSTGEISGTPSEIGTFANLKIKATYQSVLYSLGPFLVQVLGDPFRFAQWHLQNTGGSAFSSHSGVAGQDLNVLPVHSDGVFGTGVRVAVSDTGLEIAHPDLQSNIWNGASRDYTQSYPWVGNPTPPTSTSGGDHGTAVGGVIAARGWNGVGVRGVAPQVSLAGFNYLDDRVTQTSALLVDQAYGPFDIFNYSWGSDLDEDDVVPQSFKDQVRSAVVSGRGGRGSLFVKAAGNEFKPDSAHDWMTRDSNADAFNTLPEFIVVGALSAKGLKSSYSSVGSCLWISAFGGEFGDNDPAIVTTDRTGCSKGYAKSGATLNSFESGGSGNTNCDYTSTFNGTSAATPMIAGVIALILEANPNLSWRQVKHILAATASSVDTAFVPIANRSSEPSGYVWDQGWVTNAAGFAFHNYYGFGKVNAAAAVQMARAGLANWKPQQSVTEDSGSINLSIPDRSTLGASVSLQVIQNWIVEAIQLEVTADHTYTGDLGIELTSPSGTKSILFHANNSFRDNQNLAAMPLLSNAFYGEASSGLWTFKIIDASTQDIGLLKRVRMTVYGRAP